MEHQDENSMANNWEMSGRATRIAAIEGEVGSNDHTKGIVRIDEGGKIEYFDKRGHWTDAIYHYQIREQLIERHDRQGTYDHPRERGFGNNDITCFLASQKTWGPDRQDRPAILFNINVRTKPVDKSAVPLWYHENKLVLDTDNHPVREFNILPAVISSQLEGWLMVAIMHTDTRVRTLDLRARMPKEVEFRGRAGEPNHKVAVSAPNALSMRATRFRNIAGLLPREQRGGSPKIEKYIRKFYPQAYLDANSSYGYRDLTAEEIVEMKTGNISRYGNKARMHNRVAKQESSNESSALQSLEAEPNLTQSAPSLSTPRRSDHRLSTDVQASRTPPTRKQAPRTPKSTIKEPPSPASRTASSMSVEDNKAVSEDENMLDDDSFHLQNEEGQSWDLLSRSPTLYPSHMETHEEAMETSSVGRDFVPVSQKQGGSDASGAPRFHQKYNNAHLSGNAGLPYGSLAIGPVSTEAHESEQSVRRPFLGPNSHRGMLVEDPSFRFANNDGLVNRQQNDFIVPPSVLSPLPDKFPGMYPDPYPFAPVFDRRNALYDTDSFNVNSNPLAPAPVSDSSPVRYDGRGHTEFNSVNGGPHLGPAPGYGLSIARPDSHYQPQAQGGCYQPCLWENSFSFKQALMDDNGGLDNGGNNEFVPQHFSDTLGPRSVSTSGYQTIHTGDTSSAAERSLGKERSSRPMGSEAHISMPHGSRFDRQRLENELGSRGVEISCYQAHDTSLAPYVSPYETPYVSPYAAPYVSPYAAPYVQDNCLGERHEGHDNELPTSISKPHNGTSGETPNTGENDDEMGLTQHEDAQWDQSQEPQAPTTWSTVKDQRAENTDDSMQGLQYVVYGEMGYSDEEYRQLMSDGTVADDPSLFDSFDDSPTTHE